MSTQQRIFTRELIRKVNQDMIDRKPLDLSDLPPNVAASIRNTRFSREELTRAFAEARRRLVEAA